MTGVLIAFEGLDQSGKQTQAERLGERVARAGRVVRPLSFPAYQTPIGHELHLALHGERQYGPDVMQLLYVANRHERREEIGCALEAGEVIICDRYVASSVAYGEAQGLDAGWLIDIQRLLPAADLTILLDIEPATAVERKATNRDRYERDLALQQRVRASYRRQAERGGWLLLNGQGERDAIAEQVFTAAARRLGLPSTP
ncbi:MAG TPA: dTMP kinase [Vicinamibacterales bacterium]|jgi:dTMP kinase